MSAAYTKVAVTTDRRSLRVRFRIQNRSAQAWSAPDGFRIGSQIMDPETNAYIEEGPRVAPGSDVSPGSVAEIDLQLELPEHKGLYRVYVSPMREDAGWYYERGWPFLLLEVTVEAGRANLLRSRVLSLRRLRAAIFLRSLGRAFTYPFLNGWQNRGLIRSMVRRDILGRYRGSFGGLFWTLLNPLLLMLAYYFVFGIVLRARFAGDPSRSGFARYFLAGMLPWLAFSEAAGRAPFVMMEHRNFVKRLVFPLETLPINVTLAGLVTQGFALVVFLALLLATRGAIPVSVLWLPVLVAPQVLFTLGICWFLAALGVYLRDLGHVNGLLLTLWFFLTPICYPEESLPSGAMWILSKNPLFVLVRGYRTILLDPGSPPAFGPLWKLWLLSTVVFILGHAWFYKLRKTFADVI
jgi:lipopolysaccharide transport system permease protein